MPIPIEASMEFGEAASKLLRDHFPEIGRKIKSELESASHNHGYSSVFNHGTTLVITPKIQSDLREIAANIAKRYDLNHKLDFQENKFRAYFYLKGIHNSDGP